MNWKELFAKTTLEKGKQIHERNRVQNLQWEESTKTATAEVVGSVIYKVSVKAQDSHTPIMFCDCAESRNGSCCVHMAALLYAMKDSGYWPFVGNPEDFGVKQTTKKARKKSLQDYMGSGAVKKGVKESADDEVFPFEHVYDDDQRYHYFDLRKMTKNLTFNDRDCRKAQKLIDSGEVALVQLDLGYTGDRDEGMIGVALGKYKRPQNRYASEIRISFDRYRISGAMCYTSGCYRSFDHRYGKRGKLCVHELALLFLMGERLFEKNPGDATDYRGMNLMNRFRAQNRSTNSLVGLSPEAERAEYDICPRLSDEGGEGLELSFRIGKSRLYVVKDIGDLLKNIRMSACIALGKKDQLDFAAARPTERAARWLDFIRACIEDEQGRELIADEYWEIEDYFESTIPLYGSRMDDFFDVLGEDQVEFSDGYGPEKNKKILTVGDGKPSLTFTLENDTDRADTLHGVQLDAKLPAFYKGKKNYYFVGDDAIIRTDRTKIKELEPVLDLRKEGNIHLTIGRNHLASFYRLVLPVLEEYGEVIEPKDERIREILPPEADYIFYLDAVRKNVLCRVTARYGEEEYAVPHKDDGALWDMEREQEICGAVSEYFPAWDAQNGFYHCDGDEDAIYRLLESGVERLLEMGEVQSTEEFRRLKIRPRTKVSVGVSVGSEIMNLDITSEDISSEELLDVLKSYKKKKRFYRLKSGDFLRMDDENLEALESMMKAMNLKPKDFVKGKLSLPLYRAFYLDKLLEENDGLYANRDASFRKMVKEFKTVKESDYEVPDSLKKIMRNYQIYGHKWLRTLESCGFGGILADDMGLGKTLQTISVLLAADADLPALIICPASLVYNWQEEFSRFAPGMRVKTVTGTKEERKEILENYTRWDVLVTSYDLLKRDIAEYEPLHFSYQVIDEAQYIKNHNTAAAKSVKVIKSRTRYALTGTPIENRLSELWSIFDYLMPGFLYGYETFRSDYEVAITRKKDEEVTERLRKMVAPFILRRLKSDVLKDLPEKMEEIRYARLESEQQKLYDAQVLHMRKILDSHSDEDLGKDKLQILAELTRIRQICCDPSLLFDDYEGESAKRQACMDLIESAIEGEHRILVFSQFTTMLELLEKELAQRKIDYYKIVGGTAKEKRSQLVRRFNEGNVPVFLISLKAGGTGLNLTGADVVIHYDPWWNVAAQNQATDRAHRIGQKKVVSVYKLIVKDSIEEKIIRLQEEKKNLADQILKGELGGLMDMSRDELLELLR